MKKKTKEEKAADGRLKAFRKELVEKLVEGNPVAHMLKLREMKSDLRDYYRSVSPLWKAIRDYIIQTNDCVLFDIPATIVRHRGTGAAISLKDPYLIGRSEEMSIHYTIEIEYFGEGQEDSYSPDTYHSSHYIYVPVDLELDFTKAKFNAWIKKQQRKRDANVEKAERKELARLIKKYKVNVKVEA